MAIEFRCECGKRFRAKDEAVGRDFRCPACSVISSVPEPNIFVPDTSALPKFGINIGTDLNSFAAEPVQDRPHDAERNTPFWKNPVILIGGVVPGLVLAWFFTYLLIDMSSKSRAKYYQSVRADAERLIKTDPESSLAKYEELTAYLESHPGKDDEIGSVEIVRKNRDHARKLAAPIREKREAEAERRRRLAEINRATIEESDRLARFSATLSGTAWTERKIGVAEPVRGMSIRILKSELPKNKLDPLIGVMKENPRIGVYVTRLFRDIPPDQMIDVRAIWAQIHLAYPDFESKDSEAAYSCLVNEKVWNAFTDLFKVGATDTGFDGKYTIENVKGGKYYACCKYYTDYTFVEWVTELKVDRSGVIVQNFHNNNASIIQNKSGP